MLMVMMLKYHVRDMETKFREETASTNNDAMALSEELGEDPETVVRFTFLRTTLCHMYIEGRVVIRGLGQISFLPLAPCTHMHA